MNVLVIGASRGIGLEFVRQYRADGAQVTATARDDAGLERLRQLGATALRLDVADAAERLRAWPGRSTARRSTSRGLRRRLGPRAAALEPPSQADFDAVMHTNVLGAMRVLPQLADALAPGARLAVLSSRMGSIGGRGNVRELALPRVEGRAQFGAEGRLAGARRPGDLRRVPPRLGAHRHGRRARADSTPPRASPGCARVLAGLTPADNGSFLQPRRRVDPVVA